MKVDQGKLSAQQISDMKHAIGLKNGITGTFYANRNFFGVSTKVEHLDELVSQGYMVYHYKEMFKEHVYNVSAKGEKFLSEITGVCIVIE